MLFVYDELYVDHLRGIPHPESPDRAQVVASFLRERGVFTSRNAVAARDASDEDLLRAHEGGYLETVKRETAGAGRSARYLSTGDTVVGERSMAVARRAAGGAIAAVEASVSHDAPVFALVRPPGHHAEPGRGMGFCLFNNAVVAARAYQARYGGRVLVADFDYHHGNGTQRAAGQGLSYVSTHGFPAYPGTGSADENYRLPGGDAVINVPLPPHGFGTEPFVALWEELLPRAARAVRPDILIVSAGFDYVAGDPVGDLGVRVDAASALAATVARTALEACAGRVVYVLEGGYNVQALAQSVETIVRTHDAGTVESSGAQASAIPEEQRATLARIERELS